MFAPAPGCGAAIRKKRYTGSLQKDFLQLNAPSITDIFSIWNAHKVFIQGLLIQLGARAKKAYKFTPNILQDLQTLEASNKLNSIPINQLALTNLHRDLRGQLLINMIGS